MAVELLGICKSYSGVEVVRDFSLKLGHGITCVMGPSGRGKTTIVNILAGLVPPDSGTVSLPLGAKFSFVFQEDRLLDWETALTNVLFAAKRPRQKTERAKELLAEAALEDSMHKKARELSGGMRRRVALCRALIADYDIIVLDEPFKGLDDKIKPRIMDMVKRHTWGKVVLAITHDSREAEYLGGEVVQV